MSGMSEARYVEQALGARPERPYRQRVYRVTRTATGFESAVFTLPGDPLDQETDGHVDGVAVFARPGAVIIEASSDPRDPRDSSPPRPTIPFELVGSNSFGTQLLLDSSI